MGMGLTEMAIITLGWERLKIKNPFLHTFIGTPLKLLRYLAWWQGHDCSGRARREFDKRQPWRAWSARL